MNAVLNGLVVLFITLSLFSWANLALAWFRQGQPIRFEARRFVPWGGAFIAGMIVLWLAASIAVSAIVQASSGISFLDDSTSASSIQAQLLVQAISGIVVFVGAVALAATISKATAYDLGLQPNKLPGDIQLGVFWFFVIAVPTYTLQYFLTKWMPSEHPIIEMVKSQPDSLIFYVAGISAVIVAPIVEELLFRVLLQGWLERRQGQSLAKLMDAAGSRPESRSVGDPAEPESAHWPAAAATDPEPGKPSLGYEPVIISAVAFALVHLGHGPDPIPLFFLAVVLGYLYRQTHRIVPGIVVHMLLNGASMFLLWVQIHFPELVD